MNFKDSFRGKGTVQVKLFDKNTGEVVHDKVNHNLIVKTGRSTLIKMLAGELTSSITKMAVGRGGCADLEGNAFNPIPPQDGDVDLRTKVLTNTITGTAVDVSKTNPCVTFTALFDCEDVNSLVNECGLFFDNNSTMFARYTFDTVSLKSTSNLTLQISWTIEF